MIISCRCAEAKSAGKKRRKRLRKKREPWLGRECALTSYLAESEDADLESRAAWPRAFAFASDTCIATRHIVDKYHVYLESVTDT